MNAYSKLGTGRMRQSRWFLGGLAVAVVVAGRLAWLATGQGSHETPPPARTEVPAAAPAAAPTTQQQPVRTPAAATVAAPDPSTDPPVIAKAPAPTAPAGFALIPAGSFAMGNTLAASGDGRPNELPLHSVAVSAFLMAQHEVTQELWDAVRTWGASHGYTDLPPGMAKASNHPVHSLDWQALVKWCNAGSEMAGLTPCYTVAGEIYRTGVGVPDCKWGANGCRLPTEAEWERAARGGLGDKRFPWGDTISHHEANLRNDGDEPYQTGGTGDHPASATGAEPYTAPVGTFAPNAYGLFDMAGNVAEWCWDWYGPYPDAALTDPRGAATGSLRVYRGGGWRHNARDCRNANRYYSYPGGTYNYVGFRVARSCAP